MKKINKKEFLCKIYDPNYVIIDVRTVDQRLKNGVINVAKIMNNLNVELYIKNSKKTVILVNHSGDEPSFSSKLNYELLDCGFNIKNFG